MKKMDVQNTLAAAVDSAIKQGIPIIPSFSHDPKLEPGHHVEHDPVEVTKPQSVVAIYNETKEVLIITPDRNYQDGADKLKPISEGMVYWLPWRNTDTTIAYKKDLDQSRCDVFLTSTLTGCRVTVTDDAILHIANDQSGQMEKEIPPAELRGLRDAAEGRAIKQVAEKVNRPQTGLRYALTMTKAERHKLHEISRVEKDYPVDVKLPSSPDETPHQATFIGRKTDGRWSFTAQSYPDPAEAKVKPEDRRVKTMLMGGYTAQQLPGGDECAETDMDAQDFEDFKDPFNHADESIDPPTEDSEVHEDEAEMSPKHADESIEPQGKADIHVDESTVSPTKDSKIPEGSAAIAPGSQRHQVQVTRPLWLESELAGGAPKKQSNPAPGIFS